MTKGGLQDENVISRRVGRSAGSIAAPLYRQLKPGPGLSAEAVAAHQRGRMLGAMVELAGERGYRDVTVRDVTRAAGVSKASFYDNFRGKEECFIATYDAVLHEAARGVLIGERKAEGGKERLRAGLAAFAAKYASRPKAARLALVESLVAGPAVLEHASRRLGLFETLIAERFSGPPGVDLPTPVAKGIVAGVSFHARDCLIRGAPEKFAGLVDPLLEWALSLDQSAAQETRGKSTQSFPGCPEAKAAREKPASQDERDMLLTAAAKVAVEQGYSRMTRQRIQTRGGVPSESFERHFCSVVECFLAATERRAAPVATDALDGLYGADDWAVGIRAGLKVLLLGLIADPGLARLVFVETFSAGQDGVVWRHRMISEVADHLRRLAPSDAGLNAPTAEASVAAVWAVIHHRVQRDEVGLLFAELDLLTLLILAPVIAGQEPAPGRLR